MSCWLIPHQVDIVHGLPVLLPLHPRDVDQDVRLPNRVHAFLHYHMDNTYLKNSNKILGSDEQSFNRISRPRTLLAFQCIIIIYYMYLQTVTFQAASHWSALLTSSRQPPSSASACLARSVATAAVTASPARSHSHTRPPRVSTRSASARARPPAPPVSSTTCTEG